MHLSTGEFRGNKQSGYGFAQVRIFCDTKKCDFTVTIDFDDHSSNDRFRDGSCAAWKKAALAGCEYAASLVNINEGDWRISRIVGHEADTTAAFVAIAAGRAVWNAASLNLTTEVDSQLVDYARLNFPNQLR